MTEDKTSDVEDLIQSLAASELSSGEQAQMFTAMIDMKPIIEQMEVHALMLGVGITVPDPVYAFARSMIMLLRPELLVEPDINNTDEDVVNQNEQHS